MEDEQHAYDWVRSWFYDCKTELELNYSIRKFFIWLKQDCVKKTNVGLSLYGRIYNFVTVSIIDMKTLWARQYRSGRAGLDDESTTSSAEGLNYFTKNGPMASDPKQSMDTSATTQVKKTQKKAQVTAQKNAVQMESTKLWTKSDTADYLTDYAESLAVDNFDIMVLLWPVGRVD